MSAKQAAYVNDVISKVMDTLARDYGRREDLGLHLLLKLQQMPARDLLNAYEGFGTIADVVRINVPSGNSLPVSIQFTGGTGVSLLLGIPSGKTVGLSNLWPQLKSDPRVAFIAA